jgi:probable phosphoglycerate mutase
MKDIYLVRHAESEGNIGLHFQGHHTSLTERGRAQAAHVAQRAKHIEIHALISSPMVRARDTAEVIASASGIPVEESDIFAERRRPTRIVGTVMDDADAVALNAEWTESLFAAGVRVEDGENYDDIALRTQVALKHLQNHQKDSILVVSHGFFMCALLARVIHGDTLTPALLRDVFTAFHVSNTGISVLSYDGTWSVRMWNDHVHLGALQDAR